MIVKTTLITLMNSKNFDKNMVHSLYHNLKELFKNEDFKIKENGVFCFVETTEQNSNLIEVGKNFTINNKKGYSESFVVKKENKEYSFEEDQLIELNGDFVYKITLLPFLNEIENLNLDENIKKIISNKDLLKLLENKNVLKFLRRMQQISIFDWKGNIKTSIKIRNHKNEIIEIKNINNLSVKNFIINQLKKHFLDKYGIKFLDENFKNKANFTRKNKEKINCSKLDEMKNKTNLDLDVYQIGSFNKSKFQIKNLNLFEKILYKNICNKKSYGYGSVKVS